MFFPNRRNTNFSVYGIFWGESRHGPLDFGIELYKIVFKYWHKNYSIIKIKSISFFRYYQQKKSCHKIKEMFLYYHRRNSGGAARCHKDLSDGEHCHDAATTCRGRLLLSTGACRHEWHCFSTQLACSVGKKPTRHESEEYCR